MAANDLASAILEKREAVQRLKSEIQQLEHDIETLTAAARILERGAASVLGEKAPPASVRTVAPETIRKAFP